MFLYLPLSLFMLFYCFHFGNCAELNYTGFKGDVYNHKQFLDTNGDFLVFWAFDKVNITFEVQAKSTGWIGIGFSPNGGMKDADIILFYIDGEGHPILQDMFSTKNGLPIEDDHQDVQLVRSTKNDTHMCFIFTRKQISCDKFDRTLTNDTIHLIYAVSNIAPRHKANLHLHDWRGAKALHLFDQEQEDIPLPKDYKFIDAKAKNVSIPNGVESFYWCEVIELPKWEQHYLIRSEYLLDDGNEDLIHHSLLFACDAKYSNLLKSEQCWNNDLSEVSLLNAYCKKFISGYTPGAKGPHIYPNDTGLPMFQPGGETHLLVQNHYNNPKLIKNRRDSSGYRLYFASTELKFQTVIMSFFVPYGPENLIIPAGQKEFTHYMYCSAACSEYLPKKGIPIFAGSFHAHKAVSKFRLRHIRQGKQLEDMFADEHFDPEYQVGTRKKNPTMVLPGDEFILECVYDTSDRNETTFGGVRAMDEMCMAFIMGTTSNKTLAPFECHSFLSYEKEWGMFGGNYKKEYNAFENAEDGNLIQAKDFAKSYVHFPNQTVVDVYQTVVRYGTHVIRCPVINSDGDFDSDGYIEQEGPPVIISKVLTKKDECTNM